MVLFFSRLPRWAWALMGGAAVTIALLLLYRAQLVKAEARGYDRAMIEAAQAAAAASAAYQAQRDEAERAQSARQSAREARLAPFPNRGREYAKTAPNCPDDAGRSLLNEAIRASHDPAPAAKG